MDTTNLTPGRILVIFVVSGAILGSFGIYDKLINFAGAGATIPLTGFGNALAKGVREAVKKDGIMGAVTGGLSACSGGITIAVLSALIVAIIAKPKDKS